jgi:hypothetical protein
MEFGTFLARLWPMFWVVLFLGFLLLLWISVIRGALQGGWREGLLNLFVASIFTAAFLASNAIHVLGR